MNSRNWWQSEVIYQIYPWSFQDSNSDGVGDIQGIISRLDYLADLGITSIWISPIYQSPMADNGYDISDYYTIAPEFGTIDDFKFFVDTFHQNGIGIILDWVPAHFPTDAFGLAKFDGTCVYEYEDPRRGWHPDWNSLIYDFGRDTVRRFLIASALIWLDLYHIDGLRVDAVASMLYWDYSRKDGQALL